jgi:hypothetical protein
VTGSFAIRQFCKWARDNGSPRCESLVGARAPFIGSHLDLSILRGTYRKKFNYPQTINGLIAGVAIYPIWNIHGSNQSTMLSWSSIPKAYLKSIRPNALFPND